MASILISLTAFGAAEVRRHGQLWFARLAAAAGADGVEVRGELLRDAAQELPELAAWARDAGIACVYSSPAPLWRADGQLDREALATALAASAQLGATRLKMSIGAWQPAPGTDWPHLAARLRDCGITLLIENDQTASAGTLAALQRFFGAADTAGLALPMTFDMGNWHYQGECPLLAAQALAARVGYVHVKGVQRRPDQWVAVPLAHSVAPWRSVLAALPQHSPHAIEYPLAGDDLLAVTRDAIAQLRQLLTSGA